MLANLFAALTADHARSGHPLAPRVSARPAAKVCRLTGPSSAVWLHLSMITDGLTLRIVAGVALGVLVNGGLGWRATSSAWPGLAVLSLLGILAWLPRLRLAAHRKE